MEIEARPDAWTKTPFGCRNDALLVAGGPSKKALIGPSARGSSSSRICSKDGGVSCFGCMPTLLVSMMEKIMRSEPVTVPQ